MSHSMPHPRIPATLDKLDSIEWFGMSGIADLKNVKQLASWEDAVLSASSTSWENVRIEAANRIRMELLKQDNQVLNTWNERVAVVKPLARALVDDKVSAVAGTSYAEAIKKAANWDILHLCMECEYLDWVEPGFYHTLAFYYAGGHFPCGMDGDPANGIIAVF